MDNTEQLCPWLWLWTRCSNLLFLLSTLLLCACVLSFQPCCRHRQPEGWRKGRLLTAELCCKGASKISQRREGCLVLVKKNKKEKKKGKKKKSTTVDYTRLLMSGRNRWGTGQLGEMLSVGNKVPLPCCVLGHVSSKLQVVGVDRRIEQTASAELRQAQEWKALVALPWIVTWKETWANCQKTGWGVRNCYVPVTWVWQPPRSDSSPTNTHDKTCISFSIKSSSASPPQPL